MKKSIFKTAAYAILMFSLLIACDKGDVTQEDIIKNQQKIDLVINVINASNGLAPVDSALVSIVTSDGALSSGTDENGVAIFEGISITDDIPVTVTKSNFTSVTTTVDGSPNNYRQAMVSSTITLYELTGSNIAVVRGRLTIETDVTNREQEAVPADLIIRAYNYSMTNEIAFFGTTDADGNYEISIPVSSYGNDDIELVYPEITADQTVAIQDEENYVIEVVQRQTYYSLASDAKNNAIPGVPSIYVTVDAPPSESAGSGFGLAAVVVPTLVSSYSDAILVSGGSGYTDHTDTLLYLSEGANGDTAQIQVDIVGGRIINIDGFVNNGALYTEQPTLNTNFGGGSGAEIEIQFRAIYYVVITDNGSDYVDFPDAYYDYSFYSSNTLVNQTNSLNLNSYTDILDGRIVNDDINYGDTITSIISATMPELTVVDIPSMPIIAEIPYTSINATTGQITGITVYDYGYGYDQASHPAITFTTVAGYGSGAAAVINIDNDGTMDDYIITNNGSEYVRNVNDFRDDGTTSDDEEDPNFSYSSYYDGFRYVYNVEAGGEYVRSAYYGTGIPEEEE